MQNVIDLGRAAREKANVSLRTPLPTCVVVTQNQELIDVSIHQLCTDFVLTFVIIGLYIA
jgi:hypothetical protein